MQCLTPTDRTEGLVAAGRESLSLHLNLGRRTVEVVCHDQGFGLLLSSGWGSWVEGPNPQARDVWS